MDKRIKVAVIGQPNVGKSTLFNVITRGNAMVTNWPGTTVEKHEGVVRYGDYEIVFVDLPGVYGLSGLTVEEKISRNFILKENPDLVVVLVDSLLLSRTLYLAVEILELTSRVVVAVTKIDEAHRRGIHINSEALEKNLGVPVVPVAAVKGIGVSNLLKTIVEKTEAKLKPLTVNYGELESFILEIQELLEKSPAAVPYPKRWLAVKLLEGDQDLLEEVRAISRELAEGILEIRAEAARRLGSDLASFISRKRFELAEQVTRGAVAKARVDAGEEKLVRIFYNPVVAPLVSVLILLGVFTAVFTVNTGYPLNLLFEHIGLYEVSEVLEEFNLNSLLERLVEESKSALYSVLGETALARFIAEGVLGGLFALVLFIPLVAVVLVVLAIFEDAGLLTRMAIGFHMLLHRLGMSGHSLFPITLSFGCNVPGIVATRSNPNTLERARMLLLLPFVPCQARLVVLLAIASAFGGLTGVLVVPLAYILALAVVLLLNAVMVKLSRGKSQQETTELLLELPAVHKPIPRVVWWFTWYYLKHFIVKVGTIVLVVNVFVWLLSNVGLNLQLVDDASDSIGAHVSRLFAPLLSPLGVSGDSAWIVAYALMVGFLAKELFLTSILTVTGANSYVEAFSALGLSRASLATIAVFVALYVPCIATLATVYLETKRVKQALSVVLLMLATAYVISLAVYLILSILTP
ncbi:MAG: ferrous iron transport protein B [Desulfurococcaceae archaeon]